MGDAWVEGSGLSRRGFLTAMMGGVALAVGGVAGVRPAAATPGGLLGLDELATELPATVTGTLRVAAAAAPAAVTRIDDVPVVSAVPLQLSAPASAVALTLPAGTSRGWIRGGGIEGTTGWIELQRVDHGPDDAGATHVTDLAWVRAVDVLEVALPDGADLEAVRVHLSDTLGLSAAARQGPHGVAALLAALQGGADPTAAGAAAAGGLATAGVGQSTLGAAEDVVDAMPGVLERTAERWQRYLGGKVEAVLPEREAEPSRPSRPSRPSVIRRSEWGASSPRSRASTSPPRAVVLHHTATRNDYARGESAAIVRAIQHHHQRTMGWSDVGYNLLVDRYGRVFEGRAGGLEAGVVGAHARGYNTGTVGVALIGSFQSGRPPQAGREAVASVLGWQARTHGIDLRDGARADVGGRAIRTFSGHRDVGSTACPGQHLGARMGEIQRAARG